MKSSTRRALKKHAELKENWGNLVYSSVSPQSGNIREGANKMIYTKRPIVNIQGVVQRGKWTKAFDPDGDYEGPYAFGENLARHPRYMADQAEHQADMAKYMGQHQTDMAKYMVSKPRSRSRSRGTRSRSRGTRSRSRRSRSRGTRRR